MQDLLSTETLLAILLVTTFTTTGLLGLWAATSRWHWFLRAAVVLGVLAPLLFIPAYEVFVTLTAQLALIVAIVAVYRRLRRDAGEARRPVRFSLASFFLASCIVAVAVAVGVRVPPLNGNAWVSMSLMAATTAAGSCLAAWLVFGKLHIIWRLLICFIAILFLPAPLVAGDWFVLSMAYGFNWPPQELPKWWGMAGQPAAGSLWVLVVPAFVAIVTGVLCLVAAIRRSVNTLRPNHSLSIRLFEPACSVLVALALLAIVSPPIYTTWSLLNRLPIPQTELPDPNGYDDLVAAGKIAAVSEADEVDYAKSPTPQRELKAFVAGSKQAFQLAADGLSKACMVPVDYADFELTMSLSNVSEIRSLARAFDAKGELAAGQDKFEDAAAAHLTNVQLGFAIRRGGLIIDDLVGIAISGIGADGLYQDRAGISVDGRKKAIDTILAGLAQRESFDEVRARDRAFTQHAGGWHSHLTQLLRELSNGEPSDEAAKDATRREDVVLKLLAVELAVKNFQSDHDERPSFLSELVPVYLPTVPIDPFAADHSPLRYQQTDDGYHLYSVWVDGDDDHGEPPTDKYGKYVGLKDGDFRLDDYFMPDKEEPAEDPDDEPYEYYAPGFTVEDFSEDESIVD